MAMETSQEQTARHEDEAISIALLSQETKRLAGEVSDIKTNVTNHIPHQIKDLSDKFDKKFDETFSYISEKIDAHTKYDAETYSRKDNSWAERAITWAVMLFVGGFIAVAITFIVNGKLQV